MLTNDGGRTDWPLLQLDPEDALPKRLNDAIVVRLLLKAIEQDESQRRCQCLGYHLKECPGVLDVQALPQKLLEGQFAQLFVEVTPRQLVLIQEVYYHVEKAFDVVTAGFVIAAA